MLIDNDGQFRRRKRKVTLLNEEQTYCVRYENLFVLFFVRHSSLVLLLPVQKCEMTCKQALLGWHYLAATYQARMYSQLSLFFLHLANPGPVWATSYRYQNRAESCDGYIIGYQL